MPDRPAPSLFDRPAELLRMATTLIANGKGETALGLVRNLWRERPDDRLLGALTRTVLTQGVPAFHRGMLHDAARNAAYRRAIEAAAPGRRVLDIGTGSGLLAMMAARAGAARVVACEANPMLAATAREIIAANGLADRIAVLPLHSTKLDRDRDLGGGAELVISEIFSDDFVGEGVLGSLAHARDALCAPGAVFLPAAASIRVALADLDDRSAPLGHVEGFDLASFSRHFPPARSVHPASAKLALCSPPAELFAFAFDPGSGTPAARESHLRLVSAGGRVAGVVQWLRLSFAPNNVYENAPGGDRTLHWMMRFVPLDDPRDTTPGEELAVAGWHDQTRLAIWEDAERSRFP